MAKMKGETSRCSICRTPYSRMSKAEADKRAKECEQAGEPEYKFELGALVQVDSGVFLAGQSGPWHPSSHASLMQGVSYYDNRKDSAMQALVVGREISPLGPGHMPVYVLESRDGRILPQKHSKVLGKFLSLAT